jgi:hypothetical protein
MSLPLDLSLLLRYFVDPTSARGILEGGRKLGGRKLGGRKLGGKRSWVPVLYPLAR